MEQKTIVCIACYYKGYDFMEELHHLGNRVILITSDNLRDKNWPWHALDEVFYMAESSPSQWNLEHLVKGFSYLMRERDITAVIALDDYDVEKAALIRETFRIPGMGQTTHRYFRDKLAMRQKAQESGINVPEFTPIFNNHAVQEFTSKVPPPWVLKPRSEASASGIQKIKSETQLWEAIEKLGEERHLFLLERFKPGNVYHVDCIVYGGKTVFISASRYLAPPMQISHEGGVFRTRTLAENSEEFKGLQNINTQILERFGLKNGATHSEYIRGDDGQYYFLETSSRVGGAHIADMIEAATNINIWKEWARLEHALQQNKPYQIPKAAKNFGGLILALTKDRYPDLAQFQADEAVKFLPVDYHAGIVYSSSSEEKIIELLDRSAEKISQQYLNILPPTEKPSA